MSKKMYPVCKKFKFNVLEVDFNFLNNHHVNLGSKKYHLGIYFKAIKKSKAFKLSILFFSKKNTSVILKNLYNNINNFKIREQFKNIFVFSKLSFKLNLNINILFPFFYYSRKFLRCDKESFG